MADPNEDQLLLIPVEDDDVSESDSTSGSYSQIIHLSVT